MLRTRSLERLLIAAILLVEPPSRHALSAVQARQDALVDLLMWGSDTTIVIVDLTPELQAAVDDYRRRWEAYQPARPRPSDPLMEMVYDAQVRYERRLVAIGSGPDLTELAQEYVASLRPCYEWEGFHDCPEREAQFADSYQASHAGGPFAHYLPFLAAHRWLCTAEAYKYEKSIADESRSRRAYERALAVALKSQMPLVRAAAEALRRRGSCFV